jgi:hypothetical protein
MVLTIIRTTQTFDEWGNPVSQSSQANYDIEPKDFQAFGKFDQLDITDEGSLKHRMRILFLRNGLKDVPVDLGDIVEVESKKYSVLEIREFTNHKEVICRGVE